MMPRRLQRETISSILRLSYAFSFLMGLFFSSEAAEVACSAVEKTATELRRDADVAMAEA